MALDVLRQAASYPWDGGENATVLVLGGVLTLLSPLVLPAIVVLGYGLRVIEAAADGGTAPPAVTDWGSAFVDGAKAAVVVLAYLVVPLVVGAAVAAAVLGTVGFRLIPELLTPGQVASAGGLALVFGLLLAGLALALSYVLPAALVHLARTRRLAAAFALGDVRALAGADAYASAWLLALVVVAADGVVLAVLDAASLGLLGGFVSFYALLAAAFLYGRGADRAGYGVERDETPADPTAAESA